MVLERPWFSIPNGMRNSFFFFNETEKDIEKCRKTINIYLNKNIKRNVIKEENKRRSLTPAGNLYDGFKILTFPDYLAP